MGSISGFAPILILIIIAIIGGSVFVALVVFRGDDGSRSDIALPIDNVEGGYLDLKDTKEIIAKEDNPPILKGIKILNKGVKEYVDWRSFRGVSYEECKKIEAFARTSFFLTLENLRKEKIIVALRVLDGSKASLGFPHVILPGDGQLVFAYFPSIGCYKSAIVEFYEGERLIYRDSTHSELIGQIIIP